MDKTPLWGMVILTQSYAIPSIPEYEKFARDLSEKFGRTLDKTG